MTPFRQIAGLSEAEKYFAPFLVRDSNSPRPLLQYALLFDNTREMCIARDIVITVDDSLDDGIGTIPRLHAMLAEARRRFYGEHSVFLEDDSYLLKEENRGMLRDQVALVQTLCDIIGKILLELGHALHVMQAMPLPPAPVAAAAPAATITTATTNDNNAG